MFRSIRLGFARSLSTSRRMAAGQSSESTQRTALYDCHVDQGGKMVDFAGWMMPVVYSNQTIVQSHLHTREHTSIFDVSHMMQTKVHGKDRAKYIEGLVVGDIQALGSNQGTLTVFTNESGGIMDDLIVSNTPDGYLYVVSNAGCREEDLNHLQGHLASCKAAGMDVELEVMENSLLAVQGPGMCKVLQSGMSEDLSKLTFMLTMTTSLFGVDGCRITRCGYTGEDGVEISIPDGSEIHILENLLNSDMDTVQLAGLGARDSLRLEAGLCLYGNDIDIKTTPVEATLAWLIGKRRRAAADFPGASTILDQLKNKPKRKRVGFVTKSGPPPRDGATVFSADGQTEIGHVTSGCPSPSLQYNIAMGYIDTPAAKVGTEIKLQIRKKQYDGVVAKMPFLPSNYYFGSK